MSEKLNIVVSGGSSGIGKSIVTKFAASGHRVFTSYHSNEDALLALKRHHTRNLEYSFLDQGELSSIISYADKLREWSNRVGKIDVLVNNAALGSETVKAYVQSKLTKLASILDEQGASSDETLRSSFLLQALEDEALMKVNALGPLWLTDLVIPLMQRGAAGDGSSRGYSTVIFMGSVGGSISVFPEYRASDLMSKAAVTYLSKHLAAAHARSETDVFCLSPGATLTDMFRKSTLDRVSDQRLFTDQMPKQRLIDPDELAEAVYSLSTGRWARMFHGAVLDASLGLGVRPGMQTENNAKSDV